MTLTFEAERRKLLKLRIGYKPAAPARDLQCFTVDQSFLYRRPIVPRFENLNLLAGASGLYFADKRPLVVILYANHAVNRY